MRAVAQSTFVKRVAAVVRRRTAANGDSTTVVVRRWRQGSRGHWEKVTRRAQASAQRSTAFGASWP